MASIVAEGLSIEFPLYHLGARSLKKRLLSKAAIRVRTDESNRVVVSALRDLNFSIQRGAGGAGRQQRRRQDHPAPHHRRHL
ncbi:hypothetical protein ACFQU7_14155 [Pseudoroseomonas wenyumeiae]